MCLSGSLVLNQAFSGVVRFPDVGEALRASASLHESYLDMILYTHNMNKSISSRYSRPSLS